MFFYTYAYSLVFMGIWFLNIVHSSLAMELGSVAGLTSEPTFYAIVNFNPSIDDIEIIPQTKSITNEEIIIFKSLDRWPLYQIDAPILSKNFIQYFKSDDKIIINLTGLKNFCLNCTYKNLTIRGWIQNIANRHTIDNLSDEAKVELVQDISSLDLLLRALICTERTIEVNNRDNTDEEVSKEIEVVSSEEDIKNKDIVAIGKDKDEMSNLKIELAQTKTQYEQQLEALIQEKEKEIASCKKLYEIKEKELQQEKCKYSDLEALLSYCVARITTFQNETIHSLENKNLQLSKKLDGYNNPKKGSGYMRYGIGLSLLFVVAALYKHELLLPFIQPYVLHSHH